MMGVISPDSCQYTVLVYFIEGGVVCFFKRGGRGQCCESSVASGQNGGLILNHLSPSSWKWVTEKSLSEMSRSRSRCLRWAAPEVIIPLLIYLPACADIPRGTQTYFPSSDIILYVSKLEMELLYVAAKCFTNNHGQCGLRAELLFLCGKPPTLSSYSKTWVLNYRDFFLKSW